MVVQEWICKSFFKGRLEKKKNQKIFCQRVKLFFRVQQLSPWSGFPIFQFGKPQLTTFLDLGCTLFEMILFRRKPTTEVTHGSRKWKTVSELKVN